MEKLYRIISKAAHSTPSGADPGRERHRQGAGGALDPLLRPLPRPAVYAGGLRLAGAHPDRKRAVRLCQRRLHRREQEPRTGCWPSAEGGTVFLDEIGELPIDLQSKLLRALQEKEIRPVGGTKAIPINVRVLAATNRDLEQAVAQGTFRRDLYFRLERAHACAFRPAPAQAGHSAAGGALSGAHGARHRSAAQHQRRCLEADAGLRLAGQRTRAGELH